MIPTITTEPDPVFCVEGCGKEIPPVRRVSRATGREHWVCGNNPCTSCQRVAAINEQALRRSRALDRTKLPAKLKGWSFDRMEAQPLDEAGSPEPAGDFMRRMKANLSRRLGVLRINLEVVAQAKKWTEHRDHSVFLFGEVGTGKSTIAAAMVEALATPADQGWRERTEDELRRIHGDKWERVTPSRRRVRVLGKPLDVLYIDEGELLARVTNSWSGDRDPLKRVASVFLLVLDDLGTELAAATPKRREIVVQAIERLVSYRYDNGLPMVITSNLPWEDVGDMGGPMVYGRRVASRLGEMVGFDGAWAMRGPDWRNPPTHERKRKAPPRPRQDRKRAASGEDLTLI